MIIDAHCHYTFAQRPLGAAPRFSFEQPTEAPRRQRAVRRPTDFDSCMSPRALARPALRLMRRVLRITDTGPALDAHLEALYGRHLHGPGPIDRFVLLAFDAALDNEGHCPPLPNPTDAFGSDIYTSNSFVAATCRQHPQRFLFGASIHPYRPHAPQLIEEAYAAGACLLKWIPSHHNIDIADERTIAVLRTCSDLELPVLIHYGPEFTLTTQCRRHVSIAPLLETLAHLHRRCDMPTVIVAHVATPVVPWGDRRSYRLLVNALRKDFARAPLFADISALTSWGKAGFLRRLARQRDLHGKLLFGSDFPVPVALPRLRGALGRGYRAIAALPWPQQACAISRWLGFDEIVFQRAAELLPNVDYFASRAPRTLPQPPTL